jgi:glutathione-specific gamma-glutamylcyclotransferase
MLMDDRQGKTQSMSHTAHPPAGESDLWVFGYGSLMWKPGFPFAERHAATARGVHRRLCIYSYRYRGTPEQPGLVLGLVQGGCCHGVAFRVHCGDVPATRAYLKDREQTSMVYHEVFRPVALSDGRKVSAMCYVVDRTHRQYAGNLPKEELLRLVRQGHGDMGPNRDYVCNTIGELRRMGYGDQTLAWLAERL